MNRLILIVDDEPYNIMGLKVMLAQCDVPGISSYIMQAFNGL